MRIKDSLAKRKELKNHYVIQNNYALQMHIVEGNMADLRSKKDLRH